jgi:hypothetical protein
MPTCLHCHREYQRKVYFDRHVITCQFLSKSNKERQLEFEELADTPSTRDLYKIVMELAAKCNQLETQLKEVTKWATIKKQKLNILDWLNEHSVNEQRVNEVGGCASFKDLLNAITITQDDLNVLFDTDYTGGVMHVLKRHLNNSEVSPLCAFTSKVNVFYVFTEKEWVLCNNEYYNKLMHLLDKQFMGAFIQWQNENKHKGSSDDFALLYSKNMKKVMGGAFTREQLYSRIKKELYTHIQCDPPNILEYEISY